MIADVQNWFESCIIRNYAHPAAEHQVMISEDEKVKERIIRALNDTGIDMSGYRFDEEAKQFYTQRTVDGKIYELPFSDESAGTQKMIAALPIFLLALQEGRLVIVDELDAKLHPKLLKYLIMMFKNPKLNAKGAQLLFSSHDMTTMKNTVFRRDEIWFAAENQKHESEIYSLYEIRREDNERVNSTAAFDKQYLEGRYGGRSVLEQYAGGRRMVMSLKPQKKSDLDKSWMKKRRDKPIKIQPEYHLIVTEGTETEPQYFNAI
jgi:AAA15 family ATPase/GTPase